MTRRDPVACSVFECTDVPRYVWAVYLPGPTLPPAHGPGMLVRLCGTHNARPWPFPALGVRQYVGRCDRVLVDWGPHRAAS
jgi:hypothetical protein